MYKFLNIRSTSLKLLLIALLLLSGLLATNNKVKAHELAQEGKIAAILHITPDDNPVTNVPTSLILYFQTDTNGFSLNNCDCQLILSHNNNNVYQQALSPLSSSMTISENKYTFNLSGAYIITVSGKPKSGSGFRNFDLKYQVQVGEGGVNKTSSLKILVLSAFFVIQLIGLSWLYYLLRS